MKLVLNVFPCLFSAVIVLSSLVTIEAQEVETSPDPNPQTTSETVDHAEVAEDWKELLNKDLDGWEVYTGVPHKSVVVPGFGESVSENCQGGKPVGLGDPMKIFTTEMVEGKPVLNVSGQIYAGISTVESYSNYHLSVEYKWGVKKFPPRENKLRDAGVLVHCNGDHGSFWNVWLQSLECQIQETDTGDFISLAGTSAKIKVVESDKESSRPTFAPDGVRINVGAGTKTWGAARKENFEIENDWNLVEVYAFDDEVVFLVNGNVVMRMEDAKVGNQKDGQPLTSGRIQLQSEGAELTYRNVMIRDIKEMPELK